MADTGDEIDRERNSEEISDVRKKFEERLETRRGRVQQPVHASKGDRSGSKGALVCDGIRRNPKKRKRREESVDLQDPGVKLIRRERRMKLRDQKREGRRGGISAVEGRECLRSHCAHTPTLGHDQPIHLAEQCGALACYRRTMGPRRKKSREEEEDSETRRLKEKGKKIA